MPPSRTGALTAAPSAASRYHLASWLCVPKTSSTSCDQAIFVDQATDAPPFSDAVLVELGRFG